MGKLLSANFMRLWKNKVFWCSLAAMLVLAVAAMLNGCRQASMDEMAVYRYTLDHYYFYLAPVVGLFCAVFTSLFLGTEYGDGTIRNKLVVGHGRTAVYLANALVCFTAAVLFVAAWFVGGLAGIPFLGTWEMGAAGLTVYLLLAILTAAAMSAVFTMVGMVCSNRAAGAVCSILLFLGLLVCASMVYNRLCEPELSSGVIITAEGMSMAEPAPNPNYIGGTLRTVYQCILELLPTGQGILMANLEIAHILRMALFSAGVTAAATLGGILAFRRKDLK